MSLHFKCQKTLDLGLMIFLATSSTIWGDMEPVSPGCINSRSVVFYGSDCCLKTKSRCHGTGFVVDSIPKPENITMLFSHRFCESNY